MRIQLYDRGLPPGKQLFANLQTICKRLQIDYDPEYIKDMTRVYSMGLQGNTILLIDGEVVLIDKYPDIKELENIINDYRK
jgi:predicted RNA-binding protein with PUA domain